MEEEKDIFDFIEKRSIETPDSDYFKNLADKAIAHEQIEPQESSTKIIPLYRKPVVWLSGVAAAILVAFLLIPKEQDPFSTGQDSRSIEPTHAEVLAYVNENIEEFDEELLIEYIAMKNLPSSPLVETNPAEDTESLESIVDTESNDLQESLKSISDEEILDYLEMEGMNSDDLEDELFL